MFEKVFVANTNEGKPQTSIWYLCLNLPISGARITRGEGARGAFTPGISIFKQF